MLNTNISNENKMAKRAVSVLIMVFEELSWFESYPNKV